MPAYDDLLKEADKLLKYGPVAVMNKKNDPPSGDRHDYMSLAPYFWPDPSKPNGLPYMRKDGQTNPEVKDYKDKDDMPKMCDAVQTLGLAYYFSGKEMYAQHAAKLLRVWFLDKETKMNPNMNFAQAIKGQNDGRGAGLIDGRNFIKAVEGIGLIQGSDNWTAADEKGMQEWFAQFLVWMQTGKNGTDELNAKNNHGVWYDAQRMSFALFTDNTELAKKIMQSAEARLDKQMTDDGLLPLEMARTTSLHYSNFAVEAFLLLAKMGESVNVDLWNYQSPSGKSLQKGFAALEPYLSQKKVWTGEQIKPFDFSEGYPTLIAGYKKFGCKDCIESVRSIAAADTPTLRLTLTTDIQF